jgi:hypothetical protein
VNLSSPTLVLPVDFLSQVRVFRYLVYGTLILLTFRKAYVQMQDVSAWVALMVLLPIAFHEMAAREQIGISSTHAAEVVLTPLFMIAVGLEAREVLTFAWLALLSNTSLLSIRSWVTGLATVVLVCALILRQSWDLDLLVIVTWTVGLAILVNHGRRNSLGREKCCANAKEIA